MPKWGYSIIKEMLDPEKTAKASGRELKVSHKAAREVCKAIKGMMLNDAKAVFTGCCSQKESCSLHKVQQKTAPSPWTRKQLLRADTQ